MDLNQAIEKHVQWKIKLRVAIVNQQKVDAEIIAKDNSCELGVWLHGEARNQFVTLASYSALVREHATFHEEAGKVARTINAKRFAEAEAMLGADTPYSQVSSSVCIAIVRLKMEAGL